MGRHGTWRAALAAAALLLGGVAGSAAADEELSNRAAALKDIIKGHQVDKDLDALKNDVNEVVKLYTGAMAADDDKVKGQAVELMGMISKWCVGKSRHDVLKAALTGFGTMGDERASKFVKPHLRQHNLKKAGPILQTAVDTAGKAPHSDYVEPLLKIVHKSKTLPIVARAATALGGFKKIKNKRKKILIELVKTTEKDRPGTRPGDRDPDMHQPLSYGSAGSRWTTLSPILHKILNQLTGRDLHAAEEWFAMVKEYKSDLDDLFADEEE